VAAGAPALESEPVDGVGVPATPGQRHPADPERHREVGVQLERRVAGGDVERALEAAVEDHLPPIVLCLAIDEIPSEPRPRLVELLTQLRYPRWQQTA